MGKFQENFCSIFRRNTQASSGGFQRSNRWKGFQKELRWNLWRYLHTNCWRNLQPDEIAKKNTEGLSGTTVSTPESLPEKYTLRKIIVEESSSSRKITGGYTEEIKEKTRGQFTNYSWNIQKKTPIGNLNQISEKKLKFQK